MIFLAIAQTQPNFDRESVNRVQVERKGEACFDNGIKVAARPQSEQASWQAKTRVRRARADEGLRSDFAAARVQARARVLVRGHRVPRA